LRKNQLCSADIKRAVIYTRRKFGEVFCAALLQLIYQRQGIANDQFKSPGRAINLVCASVIVRRENFAAFMHLL